MIKKYYLRGNTEADEAGSWKAEKSWLGRWATLWRPLMINRTTLPLPSHAQGKGFVAAEAAGFFVVVAWFVGWLIWFVFVLLCFALLLVEERSIFQSRNLVQVVLARVLPPSRGEEGWLLDSWSEALWG